MHEIESAAAAPAAGPVTSAKASPRKPGPVAANGAAPLKASAPPKTSAPLKRAASATLRKPAVATSARPPASRTASRGAASVARPAASRNGSRAAAAARAASAAKSASALLPVSRRDNEGLGGAAPLAVPSIGEAIGLHRVADPLALRSAVALAVDPVNGEVLFQKNIHAVLPIASITKVMTAMVVLDAGQPLDEVLAIEDADRDTERFSSSRLPIGSQLTRAELMQLALMSSENRAASALARHYPGGLEAFVAAANRKAKAIGMRDSVFTEGTGLSSGNVSTARDLAVMVATASRYPLIRRFSTAQELRVQLAGGARVFRTTNALVTNDHWDLTMQKTGYISEAGNCLVLVGHVDGRELIMVLLDSHGRYSRLGDAQRLRRFIEG